MLTPSIDNDICKLNLFMENISAQNRISYILKTYEHKKIVLSSSFGAQSAVSLHLVTQQYPDIPVILIDTGYLFPETLEFAAYLKGKLNLNLHIYKSLMPPQLQEKKYGQLWTQGVKGIEKYNQLNKIEPMQRALQELKAGIWFTGIRRSQSFSRQSHPFIKKQWECLKVMPILDWSDKDIDQYLKQHDLPYHPLWKKGYLSIGDTHTTKSIFEVNETEQLRFFGLKRECGLHE